MATRRSRRDAWLEWCPVCRRRHLVARLPCPSCDGGGGSVPQPAKRRVREACGRVYECEGCEAYREHVEV
jgi:hypothetical protein